MKDLDAVLDGQIPPAVELRNQPLVRRKVVPVEARMRNILQLARTQQDSEVLEFAERGVGPLEIVTHFTQHGNRTWVRLERRGDFVQMELQCVCGCLDARDGMNPRSLLKILASNTPSYQGSLWYVAAECHKDILFVVLRSCHLFLAKWTDEDIARVMNLHLADLSGALCIEMPEGVRPIAAGPSNR